MYATGEVNFQHNMARVTVREGVVTRINRL